MTRRELFYVFGAAAGSCFRLPEQTEGPYYLDSKLNRSDIRSDPADGLVAEGVPLLLEFRVSRLTDGGCAPFAGAVVDVWHCDARGIYSGVQDPHFNTSGKKFLRGYQITDKNGIARFRTIYPGWYPGRTVHIHFKVRDGASKRGEYTSQLYFDDALTDQICKTNPYALCGRRMMRNSDDLLFRSGGDRLMLSLVPDGDGYKTSFDIALPG